ncbi:10993_t:CDS:2, partial [Gigaspora rosea]
KIHGESLMINNNSSAFNTILEDYHHSQLNYLSSSSESDPSEYNPISSENHVQSSEKNRMKSGKQKEKLNKLEELKAIEYLSQMSASFIII